MTVFESLFKFFEALETSGTDLEPFLNYSIRRKMTPIYVYKVVSIFLLILLITETLAYNCKETVANIVFYSK